MTAFAVLSVLTASAQAYAYADSDSVPEPWSGWWWPMYHALDSAHCRYCPHLWQGPGFVPESAGPMYDLDTKYFWRTESLRHLAQRWEDSLHHFGETLADTVYEWCGHCGGTSNAQAMETDPPTDCGALSQDDLEGLLAELDVRTLSDCRTERPHVKPGSLWFALQTSMRTDPKRALVVDFFADTGSVESQTAWFWPVYWYEVEYDITDDTVATGVMTLRYEDHVHNEEHASGVASYGFSCVVQANNRPKPETGEWGTCDPPPGCPGAPDFASRPRECDTTKDTTGNVNPYLNYNEIKRVIDHKTIILDDAYMDSVDIYHCWPEADSWVRRPGYADSCWAGYCVSSYSWHSMYWSACIGCNGLWNLYTWKTNPPPGEAHIDSCATWDLFPGMWLGDINQAVPSFDTWEVICDSLNLTAGTMTLVLDDFLRVPENFCYTYFDAFKLEYVGGGGGDGGASSAAVALGGKVMRVRVAPSPVRRTARISYAAPSPGSVDVVVYDVMGRAVLRAPQDVQRAGLQTATISVAGLPAGAYIARVTAKGTDATCRFVVCR